MESVIPLSLTQQIIWLFMLAIPVACIAWTVTHEQIFAEPHEYCVKKSKESKTLLARKFFYLFTCEYCFSHYVTALLLIITNFTILFADWRGYVIAGFSIVWIANVYMSLYSFLRTDLKKENLIAKIEEKNLEGTTKSLHIHDSDPDREYPKTQKKNRN